MTRDSCGLPSGSTLRWAQGMSKLEGWQRCALSITRVLVAMTLFRCVKRKISRSVQRTIVPPMLALGMQPHSCAVAFRPPYSTPSRNLYLCIDRSPAEAKHPKHQKQSTFAASGNTSGMTPALRFVARCSTSPFVARYAKRPLIT